MFHKATMFFSISGFIIFTCFLRLTEPANLYQDTLTQGNRLTTSNSLVSSAGLFTLCFFQFDGSKDFYLGIRLSSQNGSTSYYWIANRDMPIQDPEGYLTIDEYGNLKIVSNKGNSTTVLYSAPQVARNSNGTSAISAILQESGNFLVREMNEDGSVKRVLWQSIDYPTDTLIPRMKLGFDRKLGLNWTITSWRSDVSPMSGSFTLGIDPKVKQLVMWWRGRIVWSSGQWNNGSFENLKPFQKDFVFDYYSDDNATYVTYPAIYGYIVMGPSGIIFVGNSANSGSNYSCIGHDAHLLSGCTMPNPPSSCRVHDSLNLGSTSSFGVMSLKGYIFDERENLSNFDCWMECLNNCSCEAYSYVNSDQTGCEIWSKGTANFVATNNFTAGARQIYFLGQEKGKKSRIQITIISAICGVLLLSISCFTSITLWRKHKERAEKRKKQINLSSDIGRKSTISMEYDDETGELKKDEMGSDEMKSDDTHIFDFQTILEATAHFSPNNKIGEGGFGHVYKGKLANGEEIAVKRLSKSSGQGLVEFKNEVMLIVKLQHTNLVRLLGFCTDKNERILVYEYLPNKSLNFYLFDSKKRNILQWNIRRRIIEGVAQGLVYLHHYSRLRVIHRDLKSSNILLDNELNPKISDFGMARIFELRKSEDLTNRIVGTYGYMSPEYAMMGVISTKIDVYSFGILLLEIVSGKKISHEYPLNLAVYAWKLWSEGESEKLIDTMLDGSYPPIQVLRYIQIGLLCIQDQARDRPTMLEVVSFLSNEIVQLPSPKQPGLYTIDAIEELEQHRNCSTNQTTVSLISGR